MRLAVTGTADNRGVGGRPDNCRATRWQGKFLQCARLFAWKYQHHLLKEEEMSFRCAKHISQEQLTMYRRYSADSSNKGTEDKILSSDKSRECAQQQGYKRYCTERSNKSAKYMC